MTGADDRLLTTSEGVDEGSAASTAEGPGTGGEPPAGTPPTAPEQTAAAPDDVETPESRAAREAAGPGQQLETGEG